MRLFERTPFTLHLWLLIIQKISGSSVRSLTVTYLEWKDLFLSLALCFLEVQWTNLNKILKIKIVTNYWGKALKNQSLEEEDLQKQE